MQNKFQRMVAKAPQNTGGGNSQSFASRSEGAQQTPIMRTEEGRGNNLGITYVSPMYHLGLTALWKYVACMLLALVLGIGNVWAADPTHASPAIVKVANRNFLDLSSTPSNVTVSTDSYSNYGPGYFISNKNADLSKSWWGFSDTFKSSSSSYSNHKDAVGFHAVGSSSSSEFYQILQLREGSSRMVQMDFYVTGTTQIGFQWKNANTSGSKYLEFAIYEMNVSGTTATDGASPVSTIQGSTKSDADQYAASAALDGAKYYHVVVTPHNTSNINFYGLTFKHAPAASYTITYDANGGSGDAMESSTNTVSACTFTAPTGKEFKEWNTLATGLGDSYDPGDAASSDLDLFAIWQTKVEKFTVKYMDGTTELGSEVVEVGQHPAGSEITALTKDCYTFAGWSPALSGVSGSDGDEIEVNATWTPNYSSSATLISDDVVSNKPNVNTVFAASNIVSSITFSSSNYEFTSNTTKPGFYGYKDKQSGDYMKILVKQGKSAQVLFGNLGANPTITVNGVTKSLDASRATGDNAENTFTYTASAEDALVSITMGSGTNTLKKVDIVQLYTATYSDEMGLVDGEDNNVTEVTLPAPSPTTKEGKNFTGWKADQIVTVDDVEVAANTLIAAGTKVILGANTTFEAQWQEVSNFDVKFFLGYGDPDVQIGEKQSVSTGNFADAPEDPERAGYAFLGWSYDATEAHIVDVATYSITAATNFTAMWKQVWTVTFDGDGAVNVESGSKVASPNSPSQTGKVFQGWYNGEDKWNFDAVVTANLALTSKWADADPNHYVYAYNDDFHFDGVVYKTPDGKTKDPEAAEASNVALATNPYTLFSGAAGITSIVATSGIYDYKKAAGTKHITAYLKLKADDATSNVVFTIASGYTAVLKLKMNGYSSNATISLKKGDDAVTPSGTQEGTAEGKNYGELTYSLMTAGEYKLTTANKTLYISHIDLQATALPTYTVTYMPGEGTGAESIIDDDATEVRDGSTMFTAPEGKIFNGWKDGDNNDVEVGTIVIGDMTLTAQWINHYAVTFNINGHGEAIDPQDIKHGAKATRPDDPVVIGYDFGGWFTDAECTAGNEFDFNTAITAATELFAKWTAFDGCAVLVPALSGDAPTAKNQAIDLQSGSFGGAIKTAGAKDDKWSGSFAYTANGFGLQKGGADSLRIELNNDMKVGTVIKVKIYAAEASSRGLYLKNLSKTPKMEMTQTEVGAKEYTYTVEEGDGLAGTNAFLLSRNNTVYLQSVTVSNCGAAIVYHNVTSEVNIAGKGTVTLGASSVREGYTTTATYSEINPSYEFVNWMVSGAGASIENATANPATITMGTEDAVVTLNLRLIPVKFTVEYYDGTTLMGSEQVAVNEPPTASEIVTAKRHYTFLGWSDTDGGSVVALNTITSDVAATINLYAVYAPVACPTSGTIFSMAAKANELDADVQPNGNTIISLEPYAAISGGEAKVGNFGASKHIKIAKETSLIQFTGSNAYMYMLLDCQLQEGDSIKIDNSEKFTLSIDSLKTKKADIAKNTHFYIVPATWVGADTILVWRNGNNVSFNSLQVIRPAKYTVSFNLMGHGSAIADIANVLEGSKITAPDEPTDGDYSFAGWYKENTLENEWKFDVDVVEANTTLYAKWLDKSDATLKSLKYGSTDIELQAGVYTYNVSLPAFTSAVPALTAETSNPSATKVIANADAFYSEKATSTVTVTPEKVGAATQTYTVNFAKAASVALQDVTGSITWNFANAVTGTVNITGTPQVLANYGGVTNDNTFESNKLEASGEKFTAGSSANLRANYIRFHTTVPGKLSISYSNTGGSNPARYIYVNGVKYDEEGSASTTKKGLDTKVFVPAGDVVLVMKDGEDVSKNVQIYQMIFNAEPDYTRDQMLGNGVYGTLCVDHNVPVAGINGATFYELMGREPQYGKLAFDEIVSGELTAGKPYVFQAHGEIFTLFFGTKKVDDPVNGNGMYGTFELTDLSGDDLAGVYYFAQKALWSCDGAETLTIPANRAYVKLSEIDYLPANDQPAPGRRRVTMAVNGEKVATGVENVQGDDVQCTKVLIDGQLFIIRGEKMFDVTGRLVK